MSSLRDMYWTRAELAVELEIDTRTLDRWWKLKKGPPRTFLGRSPVYLKESVEAWMRSTERDAARGKAA